MTEFEICMAIKRRILTAAAESFTYNWTDEFCRKNLFGAIEKIKASKDYHDLSFEGIAKKELIDIGFGIWDDESDLLLVPLWLYPFLKKGAKFISISGSEIIFKPSGTDNDHRFGFCSFGVIPPAELCA